MERCPTCNSVFVKAVNDVTTPADGRWRRRVVRCDFCGHRWPESYLPVEEQPCRP